MKKVELNKIRRHLPVGWQAKIAKKTGVSEAYVSLVMNGHNYRADIITACVDMAEKEIQKKKELSSRVKKLPSMETDPIMA